MITLKKKIIAAFAILLVLLTAGVGNYFIDYALVPKNGGEVREVVADNPITIDEYRLAEEGRSDIWLESAPTEEVSVKTTDGLTLKGHVFTQPMPTNNWVVLVHGYQATEESLYTNAMHYHNQGYNVITYDQRAMGESEGDYITMGIKEKDDLIALLYALLEEHPQANIVLHGESMGAATVLLASTEDILPSAVKAIISDSSYTSVWDIFDSELDQRFNLTATPWLHMAGIVGLVRVDINIFTDGNVTEAVTKSKIPTLFLHGGADDFILTPMVHELYEAHPGQKDILIVEGAGHTEAKFLETELYYATIFEFINEVKE